MRFWKWFLLVFCFVLVIYFIFGPFSYLIRDNNNDISKFENKKVDFNSSREVNSKEKINSIVYGFENNSFKVANLSGGMYKCVFSKNKGGDVVIYIAKNKFKKIDRSEEVFYDGDNIYSSVNLGNCQWHKESLENLITHFSIIQSYVGKGDECRKVDLDREIFFVSDNESVCTELRESARVERGDVI